MEKSNKQSKKQNIKNFNDLPDWVKDEVTSDNTIKINKKIVEKFDLSNKQKSILFKILRNIILKDLPLDSDRLLKKLKQIELGDKKTKELGLIIVKNRLFPLQEYFKKDVRELYKNLGGKLDKDSEEKYKPKSEVKLEQKIDHIIEELNLEFESEKFRQRFEDIITLYLKEVQSKVETKILLKREKDIGGLGLKEKKINKVLNVIEKGKTPESQEKEQNIKKEVEEKPKKQSQKKDQKSKDKSETERESEKKEIKKPKSKAIDKNKLNDYDKLLKDKEFQGSPQKESDFKKQAQDIFDDISQEKEDIKKEKFKKEKLKKEEKNKKAKQTKKEKAQKIKPKVRRKYQKKQEKSQKDFKIPEREKKFDSKPTQRAHGPIGEIRILTLEDFRRWGSPKKAAQNIKDKINLLGEESVSKKAQAIKAWKNSQIYKLYLKIGEESINKEEPISEVIKEKQEKNLPTLTEKEFNTILELNEDLRF